MIGVEQSPRPLGFAKDACTATRSHVGEWDNIIESLVIAFVPRVGQILIERVAQGTFAKENQLIETFILHGTDPPFGEGVEVGRLWRELEGLGAYTTEEGIKGFGEFGITMVEQEARFGHGAVLDDQAAGDLF
jgi:hypothetical protein